MYFVISYCIYTNNGILGITSSGSTYTIGFAFLLDEPTELYEWALSQFKYVGINPSIIAMDGSCALKRAAKIVFPDMPSLLCTWHVNKRIVAKCKPYFLTNEEWNTFFAAWHSLI